jgi:hypothetical protein
MVVGGGHHDTVVVTRRCHRRAVPVTSSSPSGRRSGVRCQLAAAWRCRALITGVVSTAPALESVPLPLPEERPRAKRKPKKSIARDGESRPRYALRA